MGEYVVALLKCRGIGNSKLCKYILDNDFDWMKIKNNIKNILSIEELEQFPAYLEKAREEIKNHNDNGIGLITMLDRNFPKKLYEIKDPIVYLYYKGNIDLITKKSIAIIGSRKVLDNSLVNAERLGNIFSKNGIVVVSGLAIGIDAYAHKGTLSENGATIAVLPSDLKNIMPISNRKLADDIIKSNGCLVSEYPINFPISKFCYAKRDRIQSAIADVVFVVEANEASGTMITVKKSLQEGKKVYQLNSNNISFIKNKIDINKEDDIKRVISDINIKKQSDNSKQISLF